MAARWRRAPWPCALLLLLRAASVAPALSEVPCEQTQYQPDGSSLCCWLCPAGHYVFAHCTVSHSHPVCHVCPPGSFLPYPSGETACQRCIQCRPGDQEVVSKCTLTSDTQCQCREGSFYCNSLDCVENCLRCTRCPGAIVSPCTPTNDTACAGDADPAPPENKSGSAFSQLYVVGIVLVLVLSVLGIFCCYKKKGKLASGVRVSYQPLVRFLKGTTNRTGSLSLGSNPQSETVRSEEPEEGAELQAVVVGGSPAAPEQTLESAAPVPSDALDAPAAGGAPAAPGAPAAGGAPVTPVTPAAPGAPTVPAAPGPQDGMQAPPSLRSLEEYYRKEYFLIDESNEAAVRIDCEFVKANLGNDFKMFVRLIGLCQADIDSCEYENPGNLNEQHHKMLSKWRGRKGKDASVFRLLAALHKLELHMHLENIMNNLVAEALLGKRVENSETSD